MSAALQTGRTAGEQALQRVSVRTCDREGCTATFRPHRAYQRFCSRACRFAAWEAEHPRVAKPRPLFDLAERQMDDASLEAYGDLKDRLNHLEREVFFAIHAYLRAHDYPDVSGAELADWWGRDKTSVRPRVTGLVHKGLCEKGPIRDSRVKEKRVHGVRPVLPAQAMARAGVE